MIKAILKLIKGKTLCRSGHHYEESEGVSCPFTGNTYHYCITCGHRRSTPNFHEVTE